MLAYWRKRAPALKGEDNSRLPFRGRTLSVISLRSVLWSLGNIGEQQPFSSRAALLFRPLARGVNCTGGDQNTGRMWFSEAGSLDGLKMGCRGQAAQPVSPCGNTFRLLSCCRQAWEHAPDAGLIVCQLSALSEGWQRLQRT